MKFKAFVKKWIIKNWQYKLLAAVFAFVLWLVIMNVQDPEITKTISNIPVTIENEDAVSNVGMIYSVASGDTATIVVTGKKSIVGKLSADDFYASANFEELSLTNAIPIKVVLTGTKALYASDVTITQQTTSMVLSLDDIVSKTLPVNIEYVGSLDDDEIIDEANVEPSEIEITGPSQSLEPLIKVEATINMADVADGVTLRATPVVYDYADNVISMEGNLSSNCSEVSVTFSVSKTKSVGIRASSSGTAADGYEVTGVTTSFDSVKLKGKEADLDKVSYIQIPASVLSVEDADENVSVTVDLSNYLPSGVEIYDSNVNVVLTARIQEKETESTTQETTAETSETGETSEDDETSAEQKTTAETTK